MSISEKLDKLLLKEETNTPKLEGLIKYGIPFVVIGARAVNIYIKRPRNTIDLDILTNSPELLANKIIADFPHLDLLANDAEIRFSTQTKPTHEVLDILKPYHPIFLAVMKDAVKIDDYSVPTVEGIIALKFAAIMGKHRPSSQKMQDKTDIGLIIDNNKVDHSRVKNYVSLLYPEAPKDYDRILSLILKELGKWQI